MEDKTFNTSASPVESSFIRDHLANERTFLAWIRTALGIMAFGFVVEKFSLFLKQIAYFLGASKISQHVLEPVSVQGYSPAFGIVLVAFGTVMTLFAFIKFIRIEKEISMKNYQPAILLDIILTIIVLLIGICLVIYLVLNNTFLSHG